MSEERRKVRGMKLANAVGRITGRAGPITGDIAALMALNNQAEMRALWLALNEAKIVDELARQNYLDRGVDLICADIDAQANQVIVPG